MRLFVHKKQVVLFIILMVHGVLAPVSAVFANAICTGECDGDGTIELHELTVLVQRALAGEATDGCGGWGSADGQISIEEVVWSVERSSPGSCVADCFPFCGDGVAECNEQCDPGGAYCVGGGRSGMLCRNERECGEGEPGRCEGGPRDYTQCSSDGECGGGRCLHCIAVGGRPVPGGTCSANCTLETPLTIDLRAGEFVGVDLVRGSGAVVHSGIVGDVPLLIHGSLTLRVGADVYLSGVRPVTLKASDLVLPAIPVSTLACACVRAVPARTCGGVLKLASGTASPDCTPGFTEGDSVCANGLPPCTYVYGEGNAGAGSLGCHGLSPIDVGVIQDSRGSADPAECLSPGTGAPVCADEPEVRVDGSSGEPGSMLLWQHLAIGVKTGSCAGFCTDNDPQSQRGTSSPVLLTTGTVTAEVRNVDGENDINNGPYVVRGRPKPCEKLVADPFDFKLAGAFTAINQAMLGDIAATACLEAE